MAYAYRSKIYLAEVALNVSDLARQTAFYTQVLGLEILSQSDQEVVLGAGGKALVHLIQTNREETVKSSYGLYHMAILLPSREDLYLEDPEGWPHHWGDRGALCARNL